MRRRDKPSPSKARLDPDQRIPLRPLWIRPFALFRLFAAFGRILRCRFKATWRLTKLAGRAEQARMSSHSEEATSPGRDVIAI